MAYDDKGKTKYAKVTLFFGKWWEIIRDEQGFALYEELPHLHKHDLPDVGELQQQLDEGLTETKGQASSKTPPLESKDQATTDDETDAKDPLDEQIRNSPIHPSTSLPKPTKTFGRKNS